MNNKTNPFPVTTSPDKKRPNILVVDDDISAVAYIEVILKHLDVNIITATSAREAMQRVKGKEIALALLDIMMPEVGGVELATILQDEISRDFFPIIFISGYSKDEYEIERCYTSGSIDFILKPFNKNILIKKVSILLEMHIQKRKIKESEEMYRAILDASPDGIIVMDPKLNIIDVSDAVPNICGTPDKTTILGQHLDKVCNVDDDTRIIDIINKTIFEKQPQVDRVKIINQETSEYISCEISTSIILDEEQNPKTIMLIVRNITHRELMEQQLLQKERMAVLGEMATSIAHEINQPMNIISMSMENLLYELKKVKQTKMKYIEDKSDKIFENILRIRNIIDHIRNFSRDQQDYFAIQFNINDSINNAISMIDQQLKSEHILLSSELSEVLPHVIGNTYKFEQVILNLINNARDAMEEKQESGKDKTYKKAIKIRSYLKGKQICVDVTDNGNGIKPEKIKQVLRPFYSSKKEGKGTGIGLSISQGIIRELNGIIELESTYKMGTTVRISIPVNKEIPAILENAVT